MTNTYFFRNINLQQEIKFMNEKENNQIQPQNTVIDSSATQRVDNNKILSIGFKRDNNTFQIRLKSPINWGFLSKDGKFGIGGITCNRPRLDRIEETDSCFSMENNYEFDNKPNLSMLLAQQIKDGVTFNFAPIPISDVKVKAWIQQMKDDAKILYIKYAKPLDIEVEITSHVIERENVV